MEISVERHGGTVCIRLTGNFDSDDADSARDSFNELVAEGARRIIWDLRDVKFMNSTTLALLVSSQRRAVLDEIHMGIVIGGNKFLSGTFKTLGIDSVLRVYPTIEDALANPE